MVDAPIVDEGSCLGHTGITSLQDAMQTQKGFIVLQFSGAPPGLLFKTNHVYSSLNNSEGHGPWV